MKATNVRWELVAYFASFADGKHKGAKGRLVEQTVKIARRAREEARPGYEITRHGSKVRTSPGGAWTVEALKIRRA